VDDFRGGFENGPWWHRIFNGYSITTWMVVLNLGSTGLLVSWLMKYADNIVKVIAFTFRLKSMGFLSYFFQSFRHKHMPRRMHINELFY
jgi:UDP-sugar transporter A1/2/3